MEERQSNMKRYNAKLATASQKELHLAGHLWRGCMKPMELEESASNLISVLPVS